MKEQVLDRKADGKGLEFRRYFSREGVSPYDGIEWEYRTAAITSESGEVIFEQRNVEVPKNWSMTATNIVASKYFHGKRGTPERETSVRQLVGENAESAKRLFPTRLPQLRSTQELDWCIPWCKPLFDRCLGPRPDSETTPLSFRGRSDNTSNVFVSRRRLRVCLARTSVEIRKGAISKRRQHHGRS